MNPTRDITTQLFSKEARSVPGRNQQEKKTISHLFLRFKSPLAWNIHRSCCSIKSSFFLIFQWNPRLQDSGIHVSHASVTQQFARLSWYSVVTKVMDVSVLTRGDLPAARARVRAILEHFSESALISATKIDLLTSVDVDFPYTVITVDGFWAALWSDSGEI